MDHSAGSPKNPSSNPNSNPSLEERLRVERISTPPAYREVEALLNLAFPVPPKASFFDDFPVWNPAVSRMMQLVGAWDGTTLVGCAGGRIALLKTPSGYSLPVGIIGAVATHPDYRGQGVATRVVEICVDELIQQGAAMILLWGSEHSLYQKLGFDLCGIQKRVRLAEAELPEGPVAENLQTGWNLEIARAMSLRKTGFRLGAAELPWLSSHRNVQWRWTEFKGGISAYAGIGRGIDLKNIIHEWGGDRDAVLALLRSLKQENSDLEILGSPEGLGALSLGDAPATSEYLCLAKVIDPTAVVNSWQPNWAGTFERQENETWTVTPPPAKTSGQPSAISVAESALPVLLFGPEKYEGPFGDVFPLSLWIWGLDAA